MDDFGKILNELRKEKGYTQAQLAKKLRRGSTEVSRYENNQRIPTLDILVSLALLFNVSLNYLVGIEETKTYTYDALTQSQINLINTLILEFREQKYITKQGLSERQKDIFASLVLELTHLK